MRAIGQIINSPAFTAAEGPLPRLHRALKRRRRAAHDKLRSSGVPLPFETVNVLVSRAGHLAQRHDVILDDHVRIGQAALRPVLDLHLPLLALGNHA